MIYCPFCARQGVIHKAKVKNKDITIFICDECDTIWKTEDIREDNCINYKKFMKEYGLLTLWPELYDIQRL